MSESELGSLGQAARGKHLRGARWFLIVVGVANILSGGVELARFDYLFESQVQEYERQGLIVDRDLAATGILIAKTMLGIVIVAGFVFVACGAAIYRQPVLCTVVGLVLYLLLCASAFFLSPDLFFRGLLLRILFILGLFKTVASARGYQRAMQQQQDEMAEAFGATPQTF